MVELQIDPIIDTFKGHARDIILTSQTVVSEMVNEDDDDAWPLVVQK